MACSELPGGQCAFEEGAMPGEATPQGVAKDTRRKKAQQHARRGARRGVGRGRDRGCASGSHRAMRRLGRGRSCVWAAVLGEFTRWSDDAVWHGLNASEIQPQPRRQMVRHLATVQLVLYVAVGMLFLAT